MLHFESDYTNGACEPVLSALIRTNSEQTAGYGMDAHCLHAASLIRELCASPDADVHFLVGGTQTNQILLSAALRPHQGVLCAQSGHIFAHETGAVEATGHKVIALPSADGKLTAAQVDSEARAHREDPNSEHMVQPAAVYISQSTENGGFYTRDELEALSAACRENGLLLYVDGARLGYAMAASRGGMDLAVLARNCDAFYIGGTKQGALFGEALVILRDSLKKDFRYMIKQQGAMLAKGRLLGVQFEALFKDGCYFRLSENAIRQAEKIASALLARGVPFLYPPKTNQLFPVFSAHQAELLMREAACSPWQKMQDGSLALRICTSWSTSDRETEALLAILDRILKNE